MEEIRFREYITHNGTLCLAGKNATNNEQLIEQAEPEEIVLHTVEAGSPFVNIKGKAKKGDIKEAAIFCARFSRDWKKNQQDVLVHKFKAQEAYKTQDMKKGTFGIKKFRVIKIKKEWIKNWQP